MKTSKFRIMTVVLLFVVGLITSSVMGYSVGYMLGKGEQLACPIQECPAPQLNIIFVNQTTVEKCFCSPCEPCVNVSAQVVKEAPKYTVHGAWAQNTSNGSSSWWCNGFNRTDSRTYGCE